MSDLSRPQLAAHRGDAEGNLGISLGTGGAGVVIGADEKGTPVALRLFRPEPTQCVAVGGLRFAQVLAFRALGIGAQVVVHTARPSAWTSFARSSSDTADAVRLVPPQTPRSTEGTAQRPVLSVMDAGPEAREDNPVGPVHGSVLWICDTLSAWDVERVLRADVTLMQPLTASEALLIGSAMNLQSLTTTLTRLQADVVTVIADGDVHWVRLAQTAVEQQLIGPARRR